jgi:3-hydroxyisobutyrate dehydrogenase
MERIGFIGLGVMGKRMTKRLLDAGYQVNVYDISREAVKYSVGVGCSKTESIAHLTEYSELIIGMLPTPEATREVFIGEHGVLNSIKSKKILIDMSTSSPSLTRLMYGKFKKKGVEILDAPVSGGKAGAEKGTLAIIVGGDKRTFETVRPLLAHLGKNVFYVGEAGSGHTVKLVNNMLFSIIMAATSEAMVLGTKAGLNPKVLRKAMLAGSATSYALEYKLRDFVFQRDFTPGFSVELQTKDIDLALQLGKDLNTPLMMTNVVRKLYQNLISAGKADKDTSIIYELFEQIMQA